MFNNPIFESYIHEIYNSKPEYIKFIFQYNLVNFSLLAQDKNKNTILHLMVKNNDISSLKILIQHLNCFYSDKGYTQQVIDAQNIKGDTALHIATANNNSEIAKILHENNASIGIPNKDEYVVNLTETEDDTPSIKDSLLKKIIRPFNNKLSDNKSLNNTENNTDDFIVYISSKLHKGGEIKESIENIDELTSLNLFNQNGGGSDDLTSLNLYEQNGGGRKTSKMGRNTKIQKRTVKKESSHIHDETVKKIEKLGYSEDDAKYLKAGLYQWVKDTYPNLQNKARAEKMYELATKENIGNIDIDNIKKIIQQKKNNNMSSESSEEVKKKSKKEKVESKKEKVEKPKKEKVESKKEKKTKK